MDHECRDPSERKLLGQRDDAVRTEREGHAHLYRLLKQATQCLESMDLQGANEALKRVGAEAAFPRDDTGPTDLADSRTPEVRNAAGRSAIPRRDAGGVGEGIYRRVERVR